MAVVAPVASASDVTTTSEKPGVRRSVRAANRRSRTMSSSQRQPQTSCASSRRRSVFPKRAGSDIIDRCATISRLN